MPDDVPIPGLSFIAIDFETANSSRASVCAVGVAEVHDGEVVDQWSQLIAPPPGFDDFHAMNVSIHGIGLEHVADAPAWDLNHADTGPKRLTEAQPSAVVVDQDSDLSQRAVRILAQ